MESINIIGPSITSTNSIASHLKKLLSRPSSFAFKTAIAAFLQIATITLLFTDRAHSSPPYYEDRVIEIPQEKLICMVQTGELSSLTYGNNLYTQSMGKVLLITEEDEILTSFRFTGSAPSVPALVAVTDCLNLVSLRQSNGVLRLKGDFDTNIRFSDIIDRQEQHEITVNYTKDTQCVAEEFPILNGGLVFLMQNGQHLMVSQYSPFYIQSFPSKTLDAKILGRTREVVLAECKELISLLADQGSAKLNLKSRRFN
ncbi:MAG: hypothetical protein R2827_08945 [Bdellovibrionales bacterium]